MEAVEIFVAYAEDVLSCEVMKRLVAFRNERADSGYVLKFRDGFPENKRGSGGIKTMISAMTNMAHAGMPIFVLTDLDQRECSPELIRRWFGMNDTKPKLPENFIFRVAENETESWLMADYESLSKFLSIPVANFPRQPDAIERPKQALLSILQRKARKRCFKDMIPDPGGHVGPEYNSQLSIFVRDYWDIERAATRSRSLQRAINRLMNFGGGDGIAS
jgi:hypothetical protein